MKEVRVRFAPSPTGFLHVGGARTALFNYLFAKHHNGKMILRIEDTDAERSTKESEEQLISALTWLGIDWDEGPTVGGPYGPYRQSERTDIYRRKAAELIQAGLAYEGYAYPQELEKIHDALLEKGEPPHYTQEMISSFDTPQRRKEYAENGMSPVIYFKMPRKDYILKDMIRGEVVFKEGSVGDFVLIRSNGLPTYNYAVVVDDILMEITHVIRGDDHISNTLRQLAIYEAFDAPTPYFGHVSMILGPDGKRLSKRHGATSVEEFKDRGYLPEALINYLVLLGWSHPQAKEIISLTEMIEYFGMDRVNPSSAIFDEVKLKWMNGMYIRQAQTERVFKLSVPFILESKVLTMDQIQGSKKWIMEAIELIKTSVEEIAQIPSELSIFINEFELDLQNKEFKGYFEAQGVKDGLKHLYELINNDMLWTVESITDNIKSCIKIKKPDKKSFYMALRKILTNQFHGPDLVKTIHLIGRVRVQQRIERVVF
ncbi:MAG TPA: glutamate--tRNA ligase [Petrotogaceae bacterium]|nr:glutamate--tRNA ligase [Petrotogaceae bacterium]